MIRGQKPVNHPPPLIPRISRSKPPLNQALKFRVFSVFRGYKTP